MSRWPPDHIARGVRLGDTDLRRVIISMDTDTFEEVYAGAVANKCSFAAQARMLIEVGLETIKADEPEVRRLA